MDSFENFISNAFCNVGQSFYDSYVGANVRFRSRLGMKTVIIRRQLGHCCDCCASLAGIYNASDAPDDIYRRHDNCRCLVTCKTEAGYQDVWNKKIYKTQRDACIYRITHFDELDVVRNEMIESKHISKLNNLLDKNWEEIKSATFKNKEDAEEFLNKLGFDKKYHICVLNEKIKKLAGTDNVVFTRDNLAYCLYRHSNNYSSPEVFKKLPEVINNYDKFKLGRSGRKDDLNFIKMFNDNDIGNCLIEVKMNRYKDSEEYIVHVLQAKGEKIRGIVNKY